MRRKRLAAGEIRVRVSRDDLKRIAWLLVHTDHQSVSSMVRSLISQYYSNQQHGKEPIDGKEKTGR